MMLGRWVSFWDCLYFRGELLNFRGLNGLNIPITIRSAWESDGSTHDAGLPGLAIRAWIQIAGAQFFLTFLQCLQRFVSARNRNNIGQREARAAWKVFISCHWCRDKIRFHFICWAVAPPTDGVFHSVSYMNINMYIYIQEEWPYFQWLRLQWNVEHPRS